MANAGESSKIKEQICHIAWNVRRCPNSTPEEQHKWKDNIFGVKAKKKAKLQRELEVRETVTIQSEEEEENHEAIEGLDNIGDSTTQKKKLGPMDKYATPIDHKQANEAKKD
ncbi:hypothetical protein E2562_003747 [Oryza meyeriana var. granulata]|uniref:No apical meristem-associated C-terminal domain-containing protein n=1 Tax=Oryza meyeriana var. granulata TaxID=110450 RepID=A0A6G1BRR5_9ORYZ|nr:hypothetical protein E2562_003747 [Oryza meyeriana var. granulata]